MENFSVINFAHIYRQAYICTYTYIQLREKQVVIRISSFIVNRLLSKKTKKKDIKSKHKKQNIRDIMNQKNNHKNKKK